MNISDNTIIPHLKFVNTFANIKSLVALVMKNHAYLKKAFPSCLNKYCRK